MAWSVPVGSVNVLQDESERRPTLRPKDLGKRRPLHAAGRIETDDEDLSIGVEKKRRLNADQVNYLEASFSMDLKLEPDRKALLAKHLGIRPRQVAIWFQNRRARWKNQQLEQDYENLKTNYELVVKEKDRLLKEYDSAKELNKRLQAELACLNGSRQTFEQSGGMEAKEEQQPSSGKSEVMSTSKSGNDSSEIQDSGQSYQTLPGSIMLATANPRPEQPSSDSSVEFEPEAPTFLSDCNVGGLPILVQHSIPKGYCPDNLYNVLYEWDRQFTWCSP